MNENTEISIRADQRGFTMIELLVAAAMMVVITAAAVAMMISAMKQQPDLTERADQIGTARNAIGKMTADLRQGREVISATPEKLSLSTYCDTTSSPRAEPCVVSYVCGLEAVGATTYRCTRAVGSGTARIVVSGLSSAKVFCVVPSVSGSTCGERQTGVTPTYVGAKIELSAGSQQGKTVLEDGAALHNSPVLLGA